MARPAPLPATFRNYGLAVGLVLLALAAAWPVAPRAAVAPVLAFLAAVAVAAWRGGLGPGLAATALAALCQSYFFESPRRSFAIGSPDTVLDLLAFAALAVALSLAARSRRAALARAEAAQAAERADRDRLAVILDGVGDGIAVQDHAGRLIYANEPAARAAGFPSAEALLGAPRDAFLDAFAIVDEADNPLPPDQYPNRRALAGDAPPAATLGFRRKAGGEVRWATVRARPVRDAAGRIGGAITIIRDVTDERRASGRQRLLVEASRAFAEVELDLDEALGRLTRRVVAALGESCVVRLLSADGEWLELAAAYHRDPDARAFGEAMMRATPQRRDEGINGRVIETGEAVLIPVVEQRAFGAAIKPEYRAYLERYGTHSVLAVPLRARDRVIGVLSTARETPGNPFTADDLALLQELADRAAVAIDNARLYRQAREAIGVRDQFLLVAAHELRTPVTGLRGYAQLLLRTHERGSLDPPRLARYLAALDDATTRLARLIEDLLDVSRLRTGRLPLRPEPLDLAELARRVADRYGDLGPDHRLTLDLAADPAPVRADPSRLEQVLTNLIDNAVKYSPQGGEVRLGLTREGAGVALHVRDEGIGLPPGSIEKIFEPFARAPNAAARQIPGLGLGLHIAHEIAARHGGRLSAASDGEGRGTMMTLWLPLGAAAGANGRDGAEAGNPPQRVGRTGEAAKGLNGRGGERPGTRPAEAGAPAGGGREGAEAQRASGE